MRLLSLLLASLFSDSAQAVVEAQLIGAYETEVAPYFASGAAGEFAGADGVPIRYRVFKAAEEKGAIVLLTGRSEFAPKYSELVYDLRGSGYSIYLMDHRGQGLSGRMLPNTQKGHVHQYEDFVSDLGKFMDTVVNTSPHRKVFLVAHSMGAAIGTLYSIRHPGAFAGLALSSPMYQIKTPGYTPETAYLAALGLVAIGRGNEYAPGRGDDEWKTPFDRNQVTYSEPRYLLPQVMQAQQPSVILGGPTVRWVKEAIELDCDVRRHAGRLTAPTLILQAGDDTVVETAAQDEVCEKAKACRLIRMERARHELLMEKDAVRDRVLSEILGFLSGI